MSLSKITEGLQQPIKQDTTQNDSFFNRDAMGEYMMKRNETIVFPTHSITRFRKKKKEEQKELNKDTSPTE